MRRLARAIPLPLMAALLLVGAAWRITEAGADNFAASLTTAAMILLGAWIREYDLKVEPKILEEGGDDLHELSGR